MDRRRPSPVRSPLLTCTDPTGVATVHRIESAYGHDAFLKERERVAEIIRLGLTAAAERAEVAA